VAVLVALKKHGARQQDLWDGLGAESRREERGTPLAKVEANRIQPGRLRREYATEIKPSGRNQLGVLPPSAMTFCLLLGPTIESRT